MKLRTPLLVAAAGVAAILGSALPASAAGTATTFVLTGGTLSVAVQPTATLGTYASGALLATGTLGATTVTDTRGQVLGWSASAASTTFTDGSGPASTSVTYASGAPTTTGIVTATTAGVAVLTTTPAPVVVGTVVTGNNTASWNPTLNVVLPPSALAGTYAGTITTSVA